MLSYIVHIASVIAGILSLIICIILCIIKSSTKDLFAILAGILLFIGLFAGLVARDDLHYRSFHDPEWTDVTDGNAEIQQVVNITTNDTTDILVWVGDKEGKRKQ